MANIRSRLAALERELQRLAHSAQDIEGASTMSSHENHATSGTRKEPPHPVVEQEDICPAAVLHEDDPHAMDWEDSMASPSSPPLSSSYRGSSGDDTEIQDTNPDNDHGGVTSDDDELVGTHASTHSRQYRNPKAKEAGSTLMKRGRPVVKDPEDDSDTSTNQARHVKKPKAYRNTRANARFVRQPWDDVPEHHYFFKETMPKDWHIKNQNPRIYELDDLLEKDITKLLYPIEIKLCRGAFVEMQKWQDLQKYMEDLDIVPVCGSPPTNDLLEQDDVESLLANTKLSTPSTVRGEAIDPTLMPCSRSYDDIQTTRSDKTSSGDSEDRIPYRATHSKTAVNIKKPQQSTRVALQAKFLEEVRLHASLAPDGMELYNNTPRVELQLANFTNGVKQSLKNYHEALQQQTRLGTSSASTWKKEADHDGVLKNAIAASLSSVAGPDRSKSSKTRLHRCDFCKKLPIAPSLTKCQHVVCFECYSDAAEQAYMKTRSYPVCPTCGEPITEKPTLC